MNWTFQDFNEYCKRNPETLSKWAAGAFLLISLVFVALNVLENRSIKERDYAAQNVTPLVQSAGRKAIRAQLVTSANLFGNSAPIVAVAAPQTTLNLKLKGILSADSPRFARAIIQSGTEPSKLYSIGQSIKGAGAVLEEIRPDQVLLNRSGAIESLMLNKAGDRNGASIEFTTATSPSTDNSSAFSNDGLASATASNRFNNAQELAQSGRNAGRNNVRPDSPNGPRRKIKRPGFSGLDRAIQRETENPSD